MSVIYQLMTFQIAISETDGHSAGPVSKASGAQVYPAGQAGARVTGHYFIFQVL